MLCIISAKISISSEGDPFISMQTVQPCGKAVKPWPPFSWKTQLKIFQESREAIKEISKMPEWRHDFSATATLTKTETATEAIVDWLKDYRPFVPKIMKWLPWVFSTASLGVFALYFLDSIPESFLVFWLFLGLGIVARYLKKVQRLRGFASKVQSTFQQYNELLLQIEDYDFKSGLLSEKKKQIVSEVQKTSKVIKPSRVY